MRSRPRRPDGYTLLIAVSTHATNPALQAKVPYDGLKDFAPIALLARTPVVLYAHPSFPATDVKSLIAIGKAKSHTLNFGSGGVGTMTHLVGEMLKIQAGIEMLHIVYRGGTPAMNDLLAGHLPLQFATVAQALPQYKAGQLRALGISSAKRYPSVPEIPTFNEQGLDLVVERMVRAARAGRHAEADHRQAQCRDEADRGAARHGRPACGDRADPLDAGGTGQPSSEGETERWGALIKQLGLKGGVETRRHARHKAGHDDVSVRSSKDLIEKLLRSRIARAGEELLRRAVLDQQRRRR